MARKWDRPGQIANKEAIKQARESDGVIIGFSVLASTNDCSICLEKNGVVIPLKGCRHTMLPPFPKCKLEDGCRATHLAVLSPKFENMLKKPK